MPLKPILALGLNIVVCALALPCSAQQVTITAEGQLEHLDTPWLAPAIVRSRPYASVSILLDRSQGPVNFDQRSATYQAVSASLSLGGQVFPLTNAVLVVERFELGPLPPGYSYLIRGFTPGGWLFSLRSGSTSPSYVPDFSIPTTMPIGELNYAHDVTLRDEYAGWDAFGDGAISTVSSDQQTFPTGE